jgi:phage tail protein X
MADGSGGITYELVRILGDNITPDLLVWRRYKRPAPGVLRLLMLANPAMVNALGDGPYIPVGTIVQLPIVAEVLTGRPSTQSVVRLYGDT